MHKHRLSGFTIVELLIVIVVIGILAAITIIAFNGVQTRSNDSAAKSTVAQVMKSLNLFKVDKNAYPVSINDCPTPAATNICLNAPGVVYSGSFNPNYPVYGVGSIKGSRFYYASDAQATSNREFVQYADLAPIIDAIGLKSYKLTFDIKSADVSLNNQATVYFQNGSSSRHGGLYQTFTVTTSYSTKTFTFTPTLSNAGETRSVLAFYGTYGTGNIPTITNLKFEPNY